MIGANHDRLACRSRAVIGAVGTSLRNRQTDVPQINVLWADQRRGRLSTPEGMCLRGRGRPRNSTGPELSRSCGRRCEIAILREYPGADSRRASLFRA